MRWLALLALCAAPAYGSNVTATTGWLTLFDSNPFSGNPVIDAGSNRKFLVYYIDHFNLGACSSVAFTVGGIAPTEALEFNFNATSTDQIHCGFIWNEAAIASMTGTLVAWTGLSNNDISFLYGTIEDADQTALSAFVGSDDDPGGGDLSVTTTSSAGDLLVCGATHDLPTTTYDSWDTLTEIAEADISGDNSHMGYAAGNGGDTPTAITVTETAGNDDHSAACLVFVNAAAAAGVFDTNPTVATQSATAYTSITGSLDAAGTTDGAACRKDRGAPSVANVTAGLCVDSAGTGTEAAKDTATASPSMTPFDFNVAMSALADAFPVFDLYFTDGTNLVTLADEYLDVPAGENRCILTSVDPSSPFASVDVAAPDVLEIVSVTDPDAYGTFCDVDGTVGYSAMGDTSRQIIESDVYDVTGEAIDEYTLVYNNQAPALLDEDPLANALYEVGVDPAFGPVPPDFKALGTAVEAGASTPVSPAWPTHVTGDVGYLYIESAGQAGADLTTANGFVLVDRTSNPGADSWYTVYAARATSSTMAAPVVAGGADHVYARIITFDKVAVTGDPWNAKAVNSYIGTTNPSAAEVTSTLANTLIANFIGYGGDNAGPIFSNFTNASLTGVAERADGGTALGHGGGIGIGTGVLAAAGASGNTTATTSISSAGGSVTIAIPPIAEDTYVTDAESDAMAWSNFAGTMPTDYVLNTDNGAITLDGAGACGDFDFTTRVSDPYGGTLDLVRNIIVGDRVPDVIGDDEATATAAIQALCSFTVATVEACSEETAGNVLSTDPVMDTLVEPDTEVTLTLSSGVECPSQLRRTRGVTLPGVAIGLFSMPWTRRRRKSWRIAA